MVDVSMKASKALTSLGFLILTLLAFMTYRWVEVNDIFSELLSGVKGGNTAAKIIAAVSVCSTLIFMVHAELFGTIKGVPWVKILLGIYALLINLIFWNVFSAETLQKRNIGIFMSMMLASFDIGFAFLFDRLSLRNNIQQAIKTLTDHKNTLNDKIKYQHRNLERITAHVKQVQSEFEERTCKKCGYIAQSKKGLNSHICKIKKAII